MAAVLVNWYRKNRLITIKNGFSVRFLFNSLTFPIKLGAGCVHLTFCLTQTLQDLERSLYRCRALNSSDTISGRTHPRSQQSAFSASSTRFFDSSHSGVSGIYGHAKTNSTCALHLVRHDQGSWKQNTKHTKQTATIVTNGTDKHIRPTVRHAIWVFNMWTRRSPSVALILAHAVNIPRIDGSLQ